MKYLVGLVTGLIFIFNMYAISYAEVKYTPVADISVAGGQYFLEGTPSSFGGNSDIYFSPALNFGKDSSLVPVLSLNYSGTQDVQELVGGDTLTRQSADGGINLTYVTTYADVKTRIRTSYKKSFINETKDEGWGDGLFNYDRMLFGVEGEKKAFGHNMSLALDYYEVKFPNYSSLVSEAQEDFETAIDTYTYTEISQNAGEDVLDYSDVMVKLKGEKDYTANMSASYSYSLDLINYSDQTIVKEDGSFSPDLRKDIINTFRAGLDYNYRRAVIGLENETTFLNSNQNSYDSQATKYIENFYSYADTSFTPSLTLYLGDKDNLSLFNIMWNINWRKYSGRLVREDDASYTDSNVKQLYNNFGLSYRYPVAENLQLFARINRQVVSSNMDYEANYKYNYTATNYNVGLNWQY
ncbi:MAG: hypothetical protein ACQEQC_05315 [Elusimicrobiota bacterium]